MQFPHPPTASVVDHLKRWPALAGALAWLRGQGALIRRGGRAGMARLLAWLSPVLLVLVGQVMAGGGVVNDAYSYIDDFNDNNGVDTAASSGYSNVGGSLQATAGTMTVQSPCFSLPQPAGGVFNNWLFLEVGTSQLANTTGNTLTVQSCGAGAVAAGTVLATKANVAAGTVGLALNGIASNETSIRLNWTVNHSVSPALGGTPARLDFWRVFGKSTGPTVVNVVPLNPAIQPSQSSVFRITFNSNGAITRNAVLRLPMFDINGLSATGTAQAPPNGLASDAQKDYGNGGGLRVNRPVSITAYSTAPDGSSATSTLTANNTAGQLSWNLGDLPSGYSGSVTVTITVPAGTISPSTVAARAYVDHGATPVAAAQLKRKASESPPCPRPQSSKPSWTVSPSLTVRRCLPSLWRTPTSTPVAWFFALHLSQRSRTTTAMFRAASPLLWSMF